MVTPGKSMFQIGKSVVSSPVVVGSFMCFSKPERGGSLSKCGKASNQMWNQDHWLGAKNRKARPKPVRQRKIQRTLSTGCRPGWAMYLTNNFDPGFSLHTHTHWNYFLYIHFQAWETAEYQNVLIFTIASGIRVSGWGGFLVQFFPLEDTSGFLPLYCMILTPAIEVRSPQLLYSLAYKIRVLNFPLDVKGRL